MAAFEALLGEKLLGKEGPCETKAVLDGKVVAIYFSAHWCPPCRGFTPKLAEIYTTSLKAKNMEIVFVSSDKDEESFKDYYGEQPWLALPYEDRARKGALNKKFKVQGIPSLVILDTDGTTLTTDGRSKVMADPTGEDFPWKPKPWAEVIGDSFMKGTEIVGREALAGKHIGIYFSAHWCPPCRTFTPKLAAAYKTYKEKGLPFEVIFSTGDKDEKSFTDYYTEMAGAGGDWLAIPWADSKRRDSLNSLFEVQGIPTLVIVDENGAVINKNARGAVMNDPAGENFPWAPPVVGNLSEPEGIEESPSLCIFAEMLTPNQQDEISKQVEPIAKMYKDKAKETGEDPEIIFFVAKSSEGPVGRVRELCKLGDAPSKDIASPQMVLLDIPDQGGYYKSDAVEITTAVIEEFITSYKAKKLERLQLG